MKYEEKLSLLSTLELVPTHVRIEIEKKIKPIDNQKYSAAHLKQIWNSDTLQKIIITACLENKGECTNCMHIDLCNSRFGAIPWFKQHAKVGDNNILNNKLTENIEF